MSLEDTQAEDLSPNELSLESLKSIVRLSGNLLLYGKMDSKILEKSIDIFGSGKVRVCKSSEELKKKMRSQSVVVTDSLPPEFASLPYFMVIGLQLFTQLLKDPQKSYGVIDSKILDSLSLQTLEVYCMEATEDDLRLIKRNNGKAVKDFRNASFVLYQQLPSDPSEITEWIKVRSSVPAAPFLTPTELKKYVQSYERNPLPDQTKLFFGLRFAKGSLSENAEQLITENGGGLVDVNQLPIITTDHPEYPVNTLLLLHQFRKNKLLVVDYDWIRQSASTGKLCPITSFETKLPLFPGFFTMAPSNATTPLYRLYVEQSVDKVLLKDERFKFSTTTTPTLAHGFIGPPFADPKWKLGLPVDVPTRNAHCIEDVLKLGGHTECKYYHHVYVPRKDLWKQSVDSLNVVNVKAELPERSFITEFLSTVGMTIKGRPRSTEEVRKGGIILWDEETDAKDMKNMLQVVSSPIKLVSTRFIEKVLQSNEMVNYTDYIIQSLPDVADYRFQHGAPDLDECNVEPNRKKLKLSIDLKSHQAEQPKMLIDAPPKLNDLKNAFQIRKLLSRHALNQFLTGDLDLLCGSVAIKEFSWYPPSDLLHRFEILYDASINYVGSGVVSEFTEKLSKSINSPLVGGVYYGEDMVTAEKWARKTLELVWKMYKELGLKGHVVTNEGSVYSLFIIYQNMPFLLFRLEPKSVTVPLDSQNVLRHAVRFWIPCDAADLFQQQDYLPSVLANPQLNVICTNQCCRCEDRLNFSSIRVAHFHDPSNLPEHAKDGSPVTIYWSGKLKGYAYLASDSRKQTFDASTSEGLCELFLGFLRAADLKINFNGSGDLFCSSCTEQTYPKFLAFPEQDAKCKKCGIKVSAGIFVTTADI